MRGAIVLIGLVACNAVLGIDERTVREQASGPVVGATSDEAASTGAGGAAGGINTTGEGGACCIELPPNGWTGVAFYYQGAALPPPCDGVWAPGQVGGTGVVPGACGCGCGSPQGCPTAATLTGFSDVACSVPTGAVTSSIICADYAPSLVASAIGAPLSAAGVSCPAIESKQAPAWSEQAGLCLSTSPSLCEGVHCNGGPAGYGAARCVYRAGDHPCPSGAYSEKKLFYLTATDHRNCGCSCNVSGAQCSAFTTLCEGSCAAPGICGSIPHDNGCVTAGAPVTAASLYLTVTASATCSAQQGAITGTIDLEDSISVCCEP